MAASAYRFGPFLLDRSEFRLRREARAIDLPPKALDVLLHLVERPGVLFTKEELFDRIWPDVAVTDNALTQVISEIRQALGDSPASPTYFQTVARRGYRFIGTVEAVQPASSARAGAVTPTDEKPPDRPALAVVDFANVSRAEDLAWLSAGIAETVSGDLGNLGRFRIIDRARIREAAEHTRTPLDAAREIGADLVVTGSFQRSGDRLRIAARVIDVATSEVRADAKADGRPEDVFQMQDVIARQFGQGLGVAPPAEISRARQTSNFDAYRAAIEGRLLLESLDAEAGPSAEQRFLRAIELDPGYAPAYVGLANARCQLFERARFSADRPADVLRQALDDARRGVELDPQYAEAHATLAFVLTSAGQREEARRAARTAVLLEPHQWMHHFRLGYATWGAERLEALGRALENYPNFPFAHFQAAMVHIARGALALAASTLGEGLAVQRQHAGTPTRFPARGLHWLFGMIALARGDASVALEAFDTERTATGSEVYGSEFALAASCNRGFAFLKLNRRSEASEAFEACLDRDGTGRALLGLAAVQAHQGDTRKLATALSRASQLSAAMRANDRLADAGLIDAAVYAVRDQKERAGAAVEQALAAAPPGPFGWMLPIDPLFGALRDSARFRAALRTLAGRAA